MQDPQNDLYSIFVKDFIQQRAEDEARLLLHFWKWLQAQKGKRRTYGHCAYSDTPTVIEVDHLTFDGGQLWVHFYQGPHGRKLWKQPLAGSTVHSYFMRRNRTPNKKILWF